MLDAARKAVAFVEGRSQSELDTDELLALALARLVEIIGEAATNVSRDFRESHPEIPWQPMIGARNRLIHGYIDVDADIVWNIVTVDLPSLITALEAIISPRKEWGGTE